MAESEPRFPLEKLGRGMDAEAWLKLWDSGWTHTSPGGGNEDTSKGGHHHGHHDAYLKRNISHLTGDDTTKTILVSLCGDSRDLEWLSSLGYSVVGTELSETAVKKIFNRKGQEPIPHRVIVDGNSKIYVATNGRSLKVHVGNFFADAICPEKLGTFDCIWDSHGIISLPISQHEPYAKKLASFLKDKGKILYSLVDYKVLENVDEVGKGPAPAPVSAAHIREWYPHCEVQLLENEMLPEAPIEGVKDWSNPVVLVNF